MHQFLVFPDTVSRLEGADLRISGGLKSPPSELEQEQVLKMAAERSNRRLPSLKIRRGKSVREVQNPVQNTPKQAETESGVSPENVES